ncbi:MAG: hypothetical protein EBR10_07300 [Planctomycetes bacterium]|nr:hypothetical protein [Planctomycetota bacterium]
MASTLAQDERVFIASEAILAGLRALQVVLRQPNARVPLIKPDGSPVTAGDLAVQMAVVSVLRRRSPQWAVVGEEGEGSVAGADGAALLDRAVAAVRESLGSDADQPPWSITFAKRKPVALDADDSRVKLTVRGERSQWAPLRAVPCAGGARRGNRGRSQLSDACARSRPA